MPSPLQNTGIASRIDVTLLFAKFMSRFLMKNWASTYSLFSGEEGLRLA